MSFQRFALTGMTALACLGMTSEAFASGRNPGSLLVYPEFDNREGDVTLLTVTNTNSDFSASAANPLEFNGTVHWVQIDIDENAEDLDHLITPEERYRVAVARQ